MSEKLVKIFSQWNISEYIKLNNARIINVKYIRSKKRYEVYISVDNIIDINSLKIIDAKTRNNTFLPAKIIWQVAQDNYDLDLILDYIKYIREHKADLKLTFFSMIDKQDFIYENKTLTVKVYNYTQLELLNHHLQYYQEQLKEYGFANLRLASSLQENDFDIIDHKNKVIQQVQNNLKTNNFNYENVKNINQTNQTAFKPNFKRQYNNNNIDFNKKTYDCIKNITEDVPNVIIHGNIFKINRIFTSTKKWIYSVYITDFTDSICIKTFTKDETPDEIIEGLTTNQWISVLGDIRFDSFSKEQTIFAKKIKPLDITENFIMDEEEEKRVELHTHSKMSIMDGLASVEQYITRAAKWKHKAIAITDHLNVQSFPDAYASSCKYPDFKLIYGVEMDMLKDKVDYVENPQNHDLRSTKYVVFDIETTGLSCLEDEIIEFGAVVFDELGGEKKKYNFLIKPSVQVSSFTTQLTNITNETLESQPTIEQVMPKILEICKNAILVAHNAKFDIDFLQAWLIKLNYPPLQNTVIDTLQLARNLMPDLKNFRLGTVARRYSVNYDDFTAHRADYDAHVLTDIFETQLRDLFDKYNVINDFDLEKIHDAQIYRRLRGFHTTILVKNQQGLTDLFKLISISHTEQYYSTPKIFQSTIEKFRTNLLVGTSCVNGEIFETARNKSQLALENVMQFYDYVEVQPVSVYIHLTQTSELSIEKIENVIKRIIKAAQKLNKIIVATGDVHYLDEKDKLFRDVYINSKGIGGVNHPLFDYKNRITLYPDQHLRTTREMKKAFAFLQDDTLVHQIVVTNTNKVTDMIEKVVPIKNQLYTPKIDNVENLLEQLCYKNAKQIYGETLPEIVSLRLKKELDSIIKHGFSVVYWISHKLVEKSLDDGYLVGSRGSVGSSLVATMTNITEVNPLQAHYLCENCCYSEFITNRTVKCGFDLPSKPCPNCKHLLKGEGHDIPFETFLGFDGDKVPDIDLNFSGEYQSKAHDFIKEMFGAKNVYRAGTISTVAEKTAFGYVKAFLDNKSITDIRKSEIDRITKGCEGVKRTTGQHPGGIIVVPKEYEVEDFTPVNFPADDKNSTWLTTHFDFHAIHDNLLKLDILGHVDPTALRMLQDFTGVDPKTIAVNDPQVLSLFNDLSALNITPDDINGETTGAIGIPEFGTSFVRTMLSDTKPTSFADLVQISGLSHGTNVWLDNAKDLIKQQNIALSQVIGCRDDIMSYLIYQGLNSKTAFSIMENVRKGKGVNQQDEEEMKKHHVPEWYIDSCKKIKYMFPKAHATAYVLMAWRVTWFKINYPCEYYATYFTTRTNVFDIATLIKGPAVIDKVLKNILQRLDTKQEVSQKEKDLIAVYEVGLEMWARKIKIRNIDFKLSQATKFIVIEENDEKVVLPPFSAIDGLGESVAESIVAARALTPIKSVNDLQKRSIITKAHMKSFEQLGLLEQLSAEDQISIDLFGV